MEQRQTNTKIAGIDVGKLRLDAAVHGLEDEIAVDNTQAGVSELVAWLRAREVGRVGLEATGGYERRARSALEAAGLEVVVHQPIEVRRFAQMKRWRAKTDRLDARLIAAATAQVDTVRAAQDPRLAELAERLTALRADHRPGGPAQDLPGACHPGRRRTGDPRSDPGHDRAQGQARRPDPQDHQSPR